MKPHKVQRFASLQQMVDYGTAYGSHNTADMIGPHFTGQDTAGIRRYMASGASPAQQAPVLRMLQQIDASIQERTRAEWVEDRVGAFVNVPEFLMGIPENMRRLDHVPNEAAPVRVFVDVSTSASVSESQIATRGAAIVALIMRLAETRPLEVYAVGANTVKRTEVGVCVKLDTTPVNISMLTAVFCSPEFVRGVRLSAQCRANDGHAAREKLPWTFGHDRRQREAGMRQMFDMLPSDIYVAGASAYYMDEWTRDPARWVNKVLENQRQYDEAA